MSFSEDFGFAPVKKIQIAKIDTTTRNRLFNTFTQAVAQTHQSNNIYALIADKLGYVTGIRDYDNIKNRFLFLSADAEWYDAYDIITYFFEIILHMNDYEFKEHYGRAPLVTKISFLKDIEEQINQVLESEKSGYRMLDFRFISITGEEEIQSVKDSLANPFGAVSTHMKKALELYSDRENPDYENSIKESISAVESMCCVITGESGAQATLGKMLDKLGESGVTIHSAQKEAFKKLYGFTSDAGGIRHGSIDFTNAQSEDALYMLISCSAFINYLKVKYEQTKEQQ